MTEHVNLVLDEQLSRRVLETLNEAGLKQSLHTSLSLTHIAISYLVVKGIERESFFRSAWAMWNECENHLNELRDEANRQNHEGHENEN